MGLQSSLITCVDFPGAERQKPLGIKPHYFNFASGRMSEQGDLSQAIVEQGGPEQETATPENGIVKSESLDEEEKLELQRQLAAQNQERRKSKSGAGKGKLTRSLAVCEESSARPGGESLQDQTL
ncbi:PREDICTED: cAMP-regulated phosphoprotein 21 isoform X10 [Ceratotherium simum simum]|uniref:cAMP-regulated phosphoprotein 21 isoform X10 n=2 Tax=Ceratotherium simum simum TaxID=73337 RepID=A0ABM1D293_CERSS|nr:PREDICTED: cAMP-regulated phosphoprotein 21 isoform X10 [Ceratotherium simum simum]